MTSNNKLLEELDRETNYKILMPRMLSGKLVGQLLRFISNIKQPKYILEIGTYTGYSAICLADGLKKNGELHTIEINQELETFCKTYFQKAGLEKKIKLHIGNALDIIPNLKYQYDIVFIDADKKNYCQYYNLAMQKLRKGGCIIIDNVLWSGKVIKETDKNDPETSEIKKLNLLIKNDVRVRNTLIPIRDGLMICELL
tara:strand:- start:594 stop:1190 length:597 start_codon:yes stop_codon:yes gene_type:complete